MIHLFKRKRKKKKECQSQAHQAWQALREIGYPPLRIRAALPKLTGLTQPRVAEITGLPRPAVYQALSGLRRTKRVREIVARTYQIPVEEMFQDDE